MVKTCLRGWCACSRREVRAATLLGVLALVQTGLATPPIFTDATDEAGLGGCVHAPSGPFLLYQLNTAVMSGGAGVGDFNNDGFMDIFWTGGGATPDRLYINQGDGTFVDQAAAFGVGATHMGLGVACGDFDADGWTDIYVTSLGSSLPAPHRNRLYRNTGDGFVDVAIEVGANSNGGTLGDAFGATFGDFDLDGDLDLFVTGWAGQANARLLRNNLIETGVANFTDITGAPVITIPGGTRGFTPIFADMNGDRYPELLLAADFGTSKYYRNNGDGTFTNRTVTSGTGQDGNGMGATVGDLNRDGRPDWYVTSIYSHHRPVSTWIPGTGNMLYMNAGNHMFLERSEVEGVKQGGWGWGTVAADFNSDGWLDIAETNGWYEDNALGEPEWISDRCRMYLQQAGGGFIDIAEKCGVDHNQQGRGLITFDADNDGDLDLLVTTFQGALHYYRNDTPRPAEGGSTNSLRVELDTSAMPCLAPNGYGSTVRVFWTEPKSQTQQSAIAAINTRGGYLSQSDTAAFFGLGDAAIVDRVEVTWNNGSVTVLRDVAANQSITVEARAPGDINGDAFVDLVDLNRLLAVFGRTVPPDGADWERADIDGSGEVDVDDLVYLLAVFATDGC